MAGVAGVEPTHTVPETAVLPLYDTPMAFKPRPLRNEVQTRVSMIRFAASLVKPFLGIMEIFACDLSSNDCQRPDLYHLILARSFRQTVKSVSSRDVFHRLVDSDRGETAGPG